MSEHEGPLPLVLRLLGGFGLTIGGRGVEVSVAVQRLVVLLALEGPSGRSRVAGTLWPDSSEERALASLRTAVWRLSHVAPGLLGATAGAVRLCPEVEVDLHRFAERAASFLRDDGPPDRAGWAPPGGELLPDWGEPWLLTHRERTRQLQLHVLETAADRLCRSGHHGLALEAALAAVHADPLRESAHRAVIRVHLAEGNAAEAWRAYRACRALLLRELGVEPSAQTAQVVDPRHALGPAPWGTAGRSAARAGTKVP